MNFCAPPTEPQPGSPLSAARIPCLKGSQPTLQDRYCGSLPLLGRVTKQTRPMRYHFSTAAQGDQTVRQITPESPAVGELMLGSSPPGRKGERQASKLGPWGLARRPTSFDPRDSADAAAACCSSLGSDGIASPIAPPVPLPARLFRLRTRSCHPRRRELRGSGRRIVERPLVIGRHAAGASHRQPVGRLPQSRRGGGPRPDPALRRAVHA